jgi:hypothetical protein
MFESESGVEYIPKDSGKWEFGSWRVVSGCLDFALRLPIGWE